ncbi:MULTISPECIES: formate/nitrite transporter family protein [unclassified Mycobacterium]|uniref:formate/nitrite transporter family protein n=1 Tax=unclassified Mycobacterium TaxID=2642494 RepID=UPI0007FD41F3|nr:MULTISPECIES: formate/nitrite transporter family protein [unclassified Mycobacterium]OBG60467.1 nitrite transporter [Mycobacterium sp. E188]OBG62441.1 nitrite transporter [Mycobacterium sp. E735]OBG93059.1 nitrite transporter [Mycobacterium sp. E3298]OBH14064.1 nitrite transporter [Mycobacterium sp. E1715]OBH40029.1 nitrite transporter [Mycobacterium sp. E183]
MTINAPAPQLDGKASPPKLFADIPSDTKATIPDDPFEPLSVGAMVDRVAAMAVEKATHPWAFLMRSLVGGVMVAFGALLALMVSTGVKSPGIASLLMGLAFGMSFVLILVSGMSLITADMAAGFLAVLNRTMSAGGYAFLVVVGLIGNVLGALLFVTVCGAAGGPYLGAFAERAATVGTQKAGQPFLTALLLAVVCTWFLQTSMCMFFKARSDVARMAFAFYGPFAFVIGGTQHVIANVGFLGIPLLLNLFHPAAPRGTIGWGFGDHGLLTNLGVTTVGNLIGGTLFVALPFWVIAQLQRKAV